MIGRSERAIAAAVQAAPVLGIPLYWWAVTATQNLLVFFVPGPFLLAAGLIAALGARLIARPGFVRAQAAEALRFHAIVAAVGVVPFVLLSAAFASGVMSAAQAVVLLYGLLLTIIEGVRAFVAGTRALRAGAPPPRPEG